MFSGVTNQKQEILELKNNTTPLSSSELKEFLDAKAAEYNKPDFIDTDPIQVPHAFTRKEDIEIAGFLAATIAW